MSDYQGKAWMFTSFDLEANPEALLTGYTYLVYQYERCPETQRFHQQGYVVFTGKKRFSVLKNMAPEFHFERRKGTHTQAKAYCKKDETRFQGPYEFGSDVGIAEGQGQRSDLQEIKDMLDQGSSLEDIAESHFGDFVRYNKSFTLYKEMVQDKKDTERFKNRFESATLRGWQTRIWQRLQTQTDRQVLWCWDSAGNKGKSFLAAWLEAVHNAYLITSGKHQDIYYAYSYQPIVVMDMSRSHTFDKSLYGIIEGFKNGRVFSSKYQSKCKKFDPVKVIVFSNFAPDMDQISHDRVDEVDLDRF